MCFTNKLSPIFIEVIILNENTEYLLLAFIRILFIRKEKMAQSMTFLHLVGDPFRLVCALSQCGSPTTHCPKEVGLHEPHVLSLGSAPGAGTRASVSLTSPGWCCGWEHKPHTSPWCCKSPPICACCTCSLLLIVHYVWGHHNHLHISSLIFRCIMCTHFYSIWVILRFKWGGYSLNQGRVF